MDFEIVILRNGAICQIYILFANADSEVLLTMPVLPTMDTTGPLGNLDDNNHCYVGLVNQAMTCYLNSLIQTLYMTPEFRNAIYG